MAIVETMKLHIFREENILFPQAMMLFTKEELKNFNLNFFVFKNTTTVYNLKYSVSL